MRDAQRQQLLQLQRAIATSAPPSAHPVLQLASDYVVSCALMLRHREGSREHATFQAQAHKQWDTLAATVLGGPAWPSMRERLVTVRALVANDAYAATFQTLGQYRTALLRALDGGKEGDPS